MPLARFDNKHYIQGARVFVDSDNRDTAIDPANTQYDVLVNLNNGFDNVVGVDLSSWNIPYDTVPVFYETTTSQHKQNNLLDVYLEDIPFTHSVSFTVTLVGSGYSSTDALGKSVCSQINAALIILNGGGGTFTNINSFVYTVGSDGRLFISAPAAKPSGVTRCQFLFGSGPSAGSTPYYVLGFASATDTIMSVSPLVSSPLPSVPPRRVYRSVDLSIQQMKEIPILRRICMSGSDYNTFSYVTRNYMLLTEPLRHVDRFRVILKLADGRTAKPNAATGFDAVLDLMLVVEDQVIPSWVKQVIRV